MFSILFVFIYIFMIRREEEYGLILGRLVERERGVLEVFWVFGSFLR